MAGIQHSFRFFGEGAFLLLNPLEYSTDLASAALAETFTVFNENVAAPKALIGTFVTERLV